jgi:hypothetical protein
VSIGLLESIFSPVSQPWAWWRRHTRPDHDGDTLGWQNDRSANP